ncbi:hypothetical protein H310_14959 [Aphanomyces invadans]|uniref:Transmembrane protein n=1 Tax=Aphanomyces invadans TaxID=157072 RepID=A0A024T889_9STRA|nr:hypothetical protein H310_14959 [Aphanomyces invadans]ETV90203.1 hypothetical protein H310_14959 [Aphanomyces invadans]|eukprot:XP_008881161.1 hypothetical protein H310_14959 [Aphanomyces invadans]
MPRPKTRTLQMPQTPQNAAGAVQLAKALKTLLGYLCTILLVVDVCGNNWELIDYVGDAKHLLTPLLTVAEFDQIGHAFVFPVGNAPDHVSQVGQFMMNTSLAQIQARDSDTYILGTTMHPIQDSVNDICGHLVSSYPLPSANATSVRLGNVADGISFVRGTALSHWFSDTRSAPPADQGMNETQLRAMGYGPVRHGTDLRLTTHVAVPRPGEIVTTSISMYRFFMKAFCSGCVPGTELGLDTCAITYLYNETTHSLDVTASQAAVGSSHELGFIFQRRGGPILALYIRFAIVLLVFGVYSASQKTVQWVEFVPESLPQRLHNVVAPPLYRQPCSVFGLSDICFNSDIFVVLYTLAVLADEEISLVYSRVLYRWYRSTSFNLWIELRLMSMTMRWLWLNCFLLKAAKWTCDFASVAQYTGENRVMGWLTFSSVTWVYLSVFVLFQRANFIEYSNSVLIDLSCATQNLDAVSVAFLDSWYVRSMPDLVVVVLVNLIVLLAIDRVVNWQWWRATAKNSLCRQLMFNSTSILADVRGDAIDQPGYAGSCLVIKARALCTFRWFFSTHLTAFGLKEHPAILRAIHSARPHKTDPGSSSADVTADTAPMPSERTTHTSVAWLSDHDVVKPVPPTDAATLYLIVQDRDGHIHVVDGTKREMQELNVEVKILRDTTIVLG